MEPGRWVRITDIYHATIARPPEERASFLGEECHGDESLRKQVEAMVKSHERSGNFIESPAFAVAPELLIDEPTGDLIGQLIGHYRIESLLGVGGMGEVYLARDELLGRKVALKLLPEHLTEDETQLSRFTTEARTASALNHPNILTVHEIGAEGNRHFIATEFIEGITLRALLSAWTNESARRAGNCRASSFGAGCRARNRRRASRHQTGEHHVATGWIRKGARLRDCQTHRATAGIRFS